MTARFVLSALALSSLAGAAAAQVSSQLNLSVRFGMFQPSSGTARDAGKSWFAAGVDTRFKNIGVSSSNPAMSTYLTISADTYSKGGFRAIPVLLNYVVRSNELYFVGGAGVSFTEEPGGSDETRLAFQVGVGWDFQKGKLPLFIEAKWFTHSSGDKLNGLGLYLGARL